MHSALAVSADGLRAPLGVLAATSSAKKHRGRGSPDVSWRERFRIRQTERTLARWRHDRARPIGTGGARDPCDGSRGRQLRVVCRIAPAAESFIIRIHYDRRLDGHPIRSMALSPQREWIAERTVAVARRDVRHKAIPAHQRHPARAPRLATLRMAARSVTLPRPPQCRRDLPAPLSLNLVYVWEVNLPLARPRLSGAC